MFLKLQCWMVVICCLVSRTSIAAEFPDYTALPDRPELPDPLVMFDGTTVATAKDWNEKRRPELKALFQHYMYGFLPPKPQQTVLEEVLFTDDQFLGGKATISECRLAFKGPDLTHRMHLMVVVPNQRAKPAPVFLAMNFCGNHAIVSHPKVHVPDGWVYKSCGGQVNEHATEAGRGTQAHDWNVDLIIDRGYAFACFRSADLDPDTPDFSDGIEPAFYAPGQTSPKPDDAGTIATWAWGFHRGVDLLLSQYSQSIDPARIITVGHSRNGKTALLAAAMDERIALAIPHQAGCGGTAPNRIPVDTKKMETVKRINTHFPHWFCDNFTLFNEHPEKLPFDQHCLAALCAPRPVLYSNAIEDQWANPDGQFEMLKAADPVYRLLGVEGVGVKDRPALQQPLYSRLGYYIRNGNHSMNREDWRVFLEFADIQLGRP